MSMKDQVRVARRFQRAIRIDSDMGKPEALEGFVCPATSLEVLRSMGQHVSETKQGAFTWTGPYGSGKSSLVVAMSALLSGPKSKRRAAARIIGEEAAETLWAAMPPKMSGWRVIPVVGSRTDPAEAIGEAIFDAGLINKPPKKWTDVSVVETLTEIAQSSNRHGGMLLFVDEMGKFLEGGNFEAADNYIFQQLAEAASGSGGRFVFVGILHQAFEEYGRRLSRKLRDDWTKIHGRFIDLSVNAAGEEQIDLISRAIDNDNAETDCSALAEQLVEIIRVQRPNTSPLLATTLEKCWPLHPATACLLGPISKRRFGQNQRSLFGFLNSAETAGFQDFLDYAEEGDLYEPSKLWDYLRINLEPAILASPDGHRWASAVDTLDTCEGRGGSKLQLLLLKTIAIVDIFRERSGLVPSKPLLAASVGRKYSSSDIDKALGQLRQSSFIIYKKHLNAYAVFAGSDFDIEKAVEAALQETREIDFSLLRQLAGLQPILAKRHFHETGTLRWFDVDIAPADELVERAAYYQPTKGAVGQFILVIPTDNETEKDLERLSAEAIDDPQTHHIVIGVSRHSQKIIEHARELIALEFVRVESPELAGDSVARLEVQARHSASQGSLEAALVQVFDGATWHFADKEPQPLQFSELSSVASSISDELFFEAPKLHNELVNRHKPSGSAVAAQNILLKKMVSSEHEASLGIEGFPAEMGLYISLLKSTGLHKCEKDSWLFTKPVSANQDPKNLRHLWRETEAYLKTNQDRTVGISEIFEMWRNPPFGVRDGVMPILAVAFILSCRETVSLYRDGIYQSAVKSLDAEYLAIDPNSIQVRWMDLGTVSRELLSGMADIVRELDPNKALRDLKPIDVARGIVSVFDQLAPWTLRTSELSNNALRLRDIFRKANDPNKLIFNDLPAFARSEANASSSSNSEVLMCVRDGLVELSAAYPEMIEKFFQVMLRGLGVPNNSPRSLEDLRERARNIVGVAGDFKLDAFASRLAEFSGTVEEIEELAGLVAGKPSGMWIDTDVDRANMEIAKVTQLFNTAEAYAHVKGRHDKRQAMAMVVSVDGSPAPALAEFDVTDADKHIVEDVVKNIEKILSGPTRPSNNVILAALAQLGARYMSNGNDDEQEPVTEKRKSA
jgi:hypothetical protein